MSALHLFGVVLLGAVFAVSSWSKVHDREARRRFASAVRGWRVAPDRFAGRVATAVTTLEVATALLLLSSAAVTSTWFRLAAGLAALVLLTGLTGGLVVLLRRGTTTSCACFGTSASPVGVRHVLRNAGLLVVGLLTTWTATTAVSLPPAPAVLAVGLAGVAALLVIRFDDVVELFTPVPTTSGS